MAFETDTDEAEVEAEPTYRTAADILAEDDIREETIYVEEWKTSLRIRGLTLEQIGQVATRANVRNPRTGVEEFDRKVGMAMTFILGVVQPKFRMADLGGLYKKNASVVTRIVAQINALGPTEGAVNGAEKSAAELAGPDVRVAVGAGLVDDETDASPNHVDV